MGKLLFELKEISLHSYNLVNSESNKVESSIFSKIIKNENKFTINEIEISLNNVKINQIEKMLPKCSIFQEVPRKIYSVSFSRVISLADDQNIGAMLNNLCQEVMNAQETDDDFTENTKVFSFWKYFVSLKENLSGSDEESSYLIPCGNDLPAQSQSYDVLQYLLENLVWHPLKKKWTTQYFLQSVPEESRCDTVHLERCPSGYLGLKPRSEYRNQGWKLC